MFGRNKQKADLKEVKLEAPKLRTKEEIQVDYTNLCTKAGHLQYQIATLSKDLEVLNRTLQALNEEAMKSMEAEAKKVSEAPKAEEPKPEQPKVEELKKEENK